MKENFEDKLLLQLLEMQHGAIDLSEVKITCQNVTWANGWPEKKEAFWNVEAFMWQRKIDSEIRSLIEKEIIQFLEPKFDGTLNLDIGCGSYSYIPSVAFDISSKMLDFNEKAIKKVEGDLETKWPFEKDKFDSITAIFVLNYLKNLDLVLSEVKRVLKREGKFIVVISAKGVSDLHKSQEKNNFSFDKWKELFEKNFEDILTFEKDDLWFFEAKS